VREDIKRVSRNGIREVRDDSNAVPVTTHYFYKGSEDDEGLELEVTGWVFKIR
jgi:hypothetical protein